MPVSYADLFLTQAANFNKQIIAKDDTGETMNLYGYIVESFAKRSYYTNRVTVSFTTNIVDASNGVITISASPDVTANIGPGRLVYDVIVRNIYSGDVQRVMEGTIFVDPATTRGTAYGDYFYIYDTFAPACGGGGNNHPSNIYTNNIYAANVIFANTDLFATEVNGGIYQ